MKLSSFFICNGKSQFPTDRQIQWHKKEKTDQSLELRDLQSAGFFLPCTFVSHLRNKKKLIVIVHYKKVDSIAFHVQRVIKALAMVRK